MFKEKARSAYTYYNIKFIIDVALSQFDAVSDITLYVVSP